MASTIGSLMGYAERAATEQQIRLEPGFKSRLARYLKELLADGHHPDDIRWGLRSLMEKKKTSPQTSPYLVKYKVGDFTKPPAEFDDAESPDLQDFPTYKPDLTRLGE